MVKMGHGIAIVITKLVANVQIHVKIATEYVVVHIGSVIICRQVNDWQLVLLKLLKL